MLETLLSETREILECVEDEIKLWIRVKAADSPYLSTTHLSSYLRHSDENSVEISYNPASRSVDYAIAHEAGRILRFAQAPPGKKHVLVSADGLRSKAYRQMDYDLKAKHPELRNMVRQGYGMLYDGVLTQLLSMPGDVWINKWLVENYPGFRDQVEIGLSDIFSAAHEVMGGDVELVAPATVYGATNAMNAAFAGFVDDLLDGRDKFAGRYRGTRFEKIGSRLRALNSSDRGHVGDRETTDAWARELGLVGWYGWRTAR